MKARIEMTEIDIKEALSEWFANRDGRTIPVENIHLTVTKGYSDPRESVPDRVTAILTYDV